MAKMKCEIPEKVFVCFYINKIKYNGMIIEADNKNYKIKYSPKNPICSNFYNCHDTINISKCKIVSWK